MSKLYTYFNSALSTKRLSKLSPKLLYACFYTGLWFFLFITLLFIIAPNLYAAHQTIPGEEKAGLFYTITHLHPVVYVILFFISCLSMLNLYYQGWISSGVRGLSVISGLGKPKGLPRSDEDSVSYPQFHTHEPVHSSSRRHKSKHPKDTVAVAEEGIIATRRAVNQAHTALTSQLTPLDGLNHSIPNFHGSGSTSFQGEQLSNTNEKRRFKFTAAVDLPSPEEIEQRSHQRLIVNGTVKGPDGKGLPSVLVFLTDEHGNRLGQSARSMSKTGEFKVQANEPGRYLLNAYKRGYILEASRPIALKEESGKIEGIRIRMRPEGCLVHGRVIVRDETIPTDEMEVICIIQNESVPFSTRVSSGGTFRISGVPHDSTCYIEVLKTDGTIITRTDVFNTEKNKDVYREIIVPGSGSKKDNSETNRSNTIDWSASGSEVEDTQASLISTPMD